MHKYFENTIKISEVQEKVPVPRPGKYWEINKDINKRGPGIEKESAGWKS